MIFREGWDIYLEIICNSPGHELFRCFTFRIKINSYLCLVGNLFPRSRIVHLKVQSSSGSKQPSRTLRSQRYGIARCVAAKLRQIFLTSEDTANSKAWIFSEDLSYWRLLSCSNGRKNFSPYCYCLLFRKIINCLNNGLLGVWSASGRNYSCNNVVENLCFIRGYFAGPYPSVFRQSKV